MANNNFLDTRMDLAVMSCIFLDSISNTSMLRSHWKSLCSLFCRSCKREREATYINVYHSLRSLAGHRVYTMLMTQNASSSHRLTCKYCDSLNTNKDAKYNEFNSFYIIIVDYHNNMSKYR